MPTNVFLPDGGPITFSASPPPLPPAEPVAAPPYAAGVDAGSTPNPTYSTPAVLTLAPAAQAAPVATPAPPPPAATPPPSPEVVAAADAAGIAAAAAGAALLAGEGSAGVAAAAQAAGATPEVVQGLLDANLPAAKDVIVTSTDLGAVPGGLVSDADFAEAQRIALANDPDLFDLEPFELVDPFGLQFDALTNQPLKGGGALTEIAQACSTLGVDPLAAIANALHEGAGGAIGDQGTAYGPFQIHATDGRLPEFAKKGKNDPTVNAWAWSANGLDYAVRSMVAGKPSARGLRGHAAVYAIVYGFERPADEKGAYKTRAAEYDHLVSLGSGWPQYAAPLLLGPVKGGAVDTVPIKAGGANGSVYVPAGVNAQWRQLVDFFATGAPRRHAAVKSFAASLKGVFN